MSWEQFVLDTFGTWFGTPVAILDWMNWLEFGGEWGGGNGN